MFSFKIALGITRSKDHEIESQTVEECRLINNWPMWIQIELNSWVKYEVIGLVVQTPEGVMPVEYKWVFVQSATYGIRFLIETWYWLWRNYGPIMDAITFRFSISLVVAKILICAYLYELLENDIYLKIS